MSGVIGDSFDELNFRGIPTRVCVNCGSDILTVQAKFDEDYNIGLYLLDCECSMCHTKLTAPTPLDLRND